MENIVWALARVPPRRKGQKSKPRTLFTTNTYDECALVYFLHFPFCIILYIYHCSTSNDMEYNF